MKKTRLPRRRQEPTFYIATLQKATGDQVQVCIAYELDVLAYCLAISYRDEPSKTVGRKEGKSVQPASSRYMRTINLQRETVELLKPRLAA